MLASPRSRESDRVGQPLANVLENTMLKLLSLISKNFIIAIPITLLLGFAFGLVAPTAWLKNLIIPLTFLMVYPMMVSLKLAKVLELSLIHI